MNDSVQELLNADQIDMKFHYLETLPIDTLKSISPKNLREILFLKDHVKQETFDILESLSAERYAHIFSDTEEFELIKSVQENCLKLNDIADADSGYSEDIKTLNNLYVELKSQTLELLTKIMDCKNNDEKNTLINEAEKVVLSIIKFNGNTKDKDIDRLYSLIGAHQSLFYLILIPILVFKSESYEIFKSLEKSKIISIFNRCFKSQSKTIIEKSINSVPNLMFKSNKIFLELTKLNLSNKNFLPVLILAANYSETKNNHNEFSECANLLTCNIPEFYKDGKNNIILSSFIESAKRSKDQKKVIEFLSRILDLKVKNTSNKKEYDRESQKEILLLLQIPLLCLDIDKIYNIKNLFKLKEFAYDSVNVILRHAIKSSLLEIDPNINFTELLISKIPNPTNFALFVKLVQFTFETLEKRLGIDDTFDNCVSDFEKAKTRFSTILASMLMPDLGEYKNLRYKSKLLFNRDLYLSYSKKQDLEKIWTDTHPITKIHDGMTITLSDNPYDILLSAQNQCQSCLTIHSSNLKQIALWGIILDGRNKMIILKDRHGEIIARCVLRLMFENNYKNPCLLMEEVYPRDNDKFTEILTDYAQEIAKEMQLNLYGIPIGFYSDIAISNSEFDTGIEQYADSIHRITNKNKIETSAIEITYKPKETIEEKKQFVME